MSEHLGVSPRNGLKLRNPTYSSIRQHAEQSNHAITANKFKVIGRSNFDLDLKIIESLNIKINNPNLNNNITSTKLFTI